MDDEQDLCEIFTELNQFDKVLIRTFVDPELAVAEALREKPDLVFLDYRLPGVTGDKVAEALQLDVPIYLISGDLNVKTSFNFVKIIGKPVNNSEIQKIITEHIAKKLAR